MAARLTPEAAAMSRAVVRAYHLPGRIGAELLEAARAAFTHGLNNAALGAAIVMVLAAVLSAAFFRGVQVDSPPAVAHQPQSEADKELAAR
jgi:MFS transporter, DHA2 family, multidrug resistance protein